MTSSPIVLGLDCSSEHFLTFQEMSKIDVERGQLVVFHRSDLVDVKLGFFRVGRPVLSGGVGQGNLLGEAVQR